MKIILSRTWSKSAVYELTNHVEKCVLDKRGIGGNLK